MAEPNTRLGGIQRSQGINSGRSDRQSQLSFGRRLFAEKVANFNLRGLLIIFLAAFIGGQSNKRRFLKHARLQNDPQNEAGSASRRKNRQGAQLQQERGQQEPSSAYTGTPSPTNCTGRGTPCAMMSARKRPPIEDAETQKRVDVILRNKNSHKKP